MPINFETHRIAHHINDTGFAAKSVGDFRGPVRGKNSSELIRFSLTLMCCDQFVQRGDQRP